MEADFFTKVTTNDRDIDFVEAAINDWTTSEFPILNTPYPNKDEIKFLNSFSTYIYPEASSNELIFISKVFRFLFFLDDTSDNFYGKEKVMIWQSAIISLREFSKYGVIKVSNENSFILDSIIEDLKKFDKGQSIQKTLIKCIYNFLKAGLKEAKNLFNNQAPKSEDYLKGLMHSSGFEVALICLTLIQSNSIDLNDLFENKYKKLRKTLARIICLSNDLDSYTKEEAKGDFHNMVLLLEKHKGFTRKKAIQSVKFKLSKYLKNYNSLEKIFLKNPSKESDEIIINFRKILVGCQNWAKVNKIRYHQEKTG